MAIVEELRFRPCVDPEDPDDYRPRSRWAAAADPDSETGPFVQHSVVTVDRVAPGDRVPLHTHPIDEVIVVCGAAAVIHLGDRTTTVAPGGVVFVPRGTPHGGAPVEGEVTFIGFFAEAVVEVTYLERNPAPGTEGQDPQPKVVFDVRAEMDVV